METLSTWFRAEFRAYIKTCTRFIIKNNKEIEKEQQRFTDEFFRLIHIYMTFELLLIQNSTSNQIPGDKIDNDQDGLIDEEYCGFLLGGKINYSMCT